jgi:hypothetical protein
MEHFSYAFYRMGEQEHRVTKVFLNFRFQANPSDTQTSVYYEV